MLEDFSGKRFLVCGSESETGKAILDQLQLQNAQVVICSASDSNKQHRYLDWDGENLAPIEALVKEEVHANGPFYGFVYAHGMGGVRPLKLTKPSFTQDMMHANFYVFLEWVRVLSLKGNFLPGGSMVAISSVSAVRGLKSKIAYSASKAALDAAIRCIAAELGDKKIRVNSILKGWVSSDMKSDFIQNNMSLSESQDLARQILGVTEPEELAHTVSFLLSEKTPSITGTALVLDGGYTL